MELKNQVCSLELSKKLKELGCKQESLWYWVEYYGKLDIPIGTPILSLKKDISEVVYSESEDVIASAYTAVELGEMLADMVLSEKGMSAYSNKRMWQCGYIGKGGDTHWEMDDIEANARAKMRIYLLENKLIKGE